MNDGFVFIVDDDASMRTALTRLLESAGFKPVAFSSGEEFLATQLPDVACCVVLDIRMPAMSGLEVQQNIAALDPELPIIFLTGHGDIRTAVHAMQAGAVEFLPKPVIDEELLAAIRKAIERHEAVRQMRKSREAVISRIASLTTREREVMEGVARGMLNKQIGQQLGVTEKTVKVHRARVMEKMGVVSVAELVRMLERVESRPPEHP
jgi:FixJ family two-component response regulator